MHSESPAQLEPFELEVVSQMSEADYIHWSAIRITRPGRARTYRWILTLFALACFASWYTLALGIVLGVVAVVVWTMPRWTAWSNRNMYRKSEYLHGPLIYGMSSRGLWFRGGALRAESTWEGLSTWGEQDGFFWLSPWGMPQLIFPVTTLRDAGLYERVRDLAAAHGVEFDSQAAKAGLRTERSAAAT